MNSRTAATPVADDDCASLGSATRRFCACAAEGAFAAGAVFRAASGRSLLRLPAAFSALYRTAQDWDHSTIYEPFANDRRIYLPRGKVLGGSSSINAMIYIRGNPLDYDEWGAGWTWDELLPYFKRSEDNERGADAWHATGGPLTVCDSRSNNVMADAFVDAANNAELGVLTWKLQLAPGEQKKVRVSYSVKYPKDKFVNLGV